MPPTDADVVEVAFTKRDVQDVAGSLASLSILLTDVLPHLKADPEGPVGEWSVDEWFPQEHYERLERARANFRSMDAVFRKRDELRRQEAALKAGGRR